jgi:hypothetical protein
MFLLNLIKHSVDMKKKEKEIIQSNPYFKDKNLLQIKFIPVDNNIARMKLYGCYTGDKFIYKGETVVVEEDQKPRISITPAELQAIDFILEGEKQDVLVKGTRRMLLGDFKNDDTIIVSDTIKYTYFQNDFIETLL